MYNYIELHDGSKGDFEAREKELMQNNKGKRKCGCLGGRRRGQDDQGRSKRSKRALVKMVESRRLFVHGLM